ncbi:MAG: AAA family ATPase, partial [Pseudomonadota bacterium]|nr:AAA family ATPase [Pseudomonadota bacterium]
MLTLPNYEIIKKIHQSSRSLIYRGLRHQDKKPVIIKLLNAEYPTVTALSYYRQEYDIIKNLDLDGVIKAYSLEHYQNTLMILLEDFGGEALKTLLTHASFRQNYLDCIPSFLSLALQITHCLSQIHAQNIIHKTLNPSHIVFNPLTQQVKLIDFSASSLFNDDKLSEGHWAYMAPEQSGRMNRSLDYHTDLYALGVIFYELLSGQLPFNGQTPLEFIHCHLAKIPTPIQMLNSQIPEILNHIVMKLMAKNVADRYQSALGLQYDLQYCWQQWQSSQKLKTFVLARHDVIAKLYIPQKLYGRETEIQQLRHLFNRVTQGSTEIVVIRGYSGVGKTALVQELHQLEHQGYFATGKFDQYQRDRPYLGLSYALDELYHYLLMESPQQLQHWQTEISAAVGTPILGHMMPQFQWVVEQPTSEGTDVAQVLQTRFHSAFQNFLKVFTHKQQPLILFLDDIQWADAGSLELLTELLTQAHTRYLLIILAYRNHELNHNQTVTRLLNALKTHPQALTTLELDNLAYPHLAQLIQDTFPKIPQQRLNPLIELIYQKTQGNPYFTKAFLKSLYEEQQLRFDRQQQLWQWDLEQIAKKSATYNVIDFLAQKITQLALETQELLKLAAIIGHQFDLKTLTVIHQQDPETTLALLWPAIEAGLILPLTAKHHHLMVIQRPLQEEANDNIHYRFQHDRVRQAICSLMAETDKQHLHYHIGQLLFTHTHHLEERIFEIVDHFNLAIAWIEAAEKKLIANLNLQAAQKAQAASAYTSALKYIHAGLSLLSPQSWHSDYELNLQLHLLAIELELIHSNWEQAHYYAQQVL